MDANAVVVEEDPNKWLFVVKEHRSLYHSQTTGIACAVKKIVNGKKRIFLLTCNDTQNQHENIFAHCSCKNQLNFVQRLLFHTEHEPFDISTSREDDIFSFTPVKRNVKKCCRNSLRMVSESEDARKKLSQGLKSGCRSFIITEDSFRTVHWLYQEKQGRHYLQNKDLPKHDHEALGSPVLWTDDQGRSFVVGVVGYSPDRKELRPKFFTESALQITEVPMPVQLNELPPKVDENHITLKWSQLQGEGESIDKYTVYRRTVDSLDRVSKWEVLKTIADSSVFEFTVDGLERGKKYEFRVIATNNYGEGLKAEGKRVKVSKDTPMSVEITYVSSDPKSNEFTLTWVEPNNNGAPILDYLVYQRTVSDDGGVSDWEFFELVPAASTCDETKYPIKLERGKTFDLIVTAKNKCGESSKKEEKAKRIKVPEELPAPVELTDIPSFVNGNKITLRWRKPSDNGANITRYTVYQRIVSEDTNKLDWQFIANLYPPASEYVILVERSKKYEFIVTATNKCGESKKNEVNAKRVDVSGDFIEKHSKFVYEEILRLLQRFVVPLADIGRRVQVLEKNFANVGFGLLVLFLLGGLALWCLWASGLFGVGSLFLFFLGAVTVWHFWHTGDVDFQVVASHMEQAHTEVKRLLPQFVLNVSENILPRVQKLKDNYANVVSEFLDLFLMGILAVCCHWVAGFFVNVGFGSLLLLLLGILAVWHLWRTDLFENVGYRVLVLFLLGSLAVWCLWASGFIGSGSLLLILLGIVVALHIWRTVDADGFGVVQSQVGQLYTNVKRRLPRSVCSIWETAVLSRVQGLKAYLSYVGTEVLMGILAVCCLWATGFFVNVSFLVLLFLGILAVGYLWRTEYFANFGFGSVLVLVLGISAVFYLWQSRVYGKKIKM